MTTIEIFTGLKTITDRIRNIKKQESYFKKSIDAKKEVEKITLDEAITITMSNRKSMREYEEKRNNGSCLKNIFMEDGRLLTPYNYAVLCLLDRKIMRQMK